MRIYLTAFSSRSRASALAAIDQPVKLDTGLALQRPRKKRRRASVQRNSIRRSARRRPALEAAAACSKMGRRPLWRRVRQLVHAGRRRRQRRRQRGSPKAPPPEGAAPRGPGQQRGLPVPKCLDGREVRIGKTSRHGVAPSRRLHERLRRSARDRRRKSRDEGRGAGHHQLPARHLRLLLASRADRRNLRTMPRATTRFWIRPRRSRGCRRISLPSVATPRECWCSATRPAPPASAIWSHRR